jgi:hypothetical protein
MSQVWGAHASRVLASASRDRKLFKCIDTLFDRSQKRSFRRAAETSTRAACATLTADPAAQHRQERVNLANVRK